MNLSESDKRFYHMYLKALNRAIERSEFALAARYRLAMLSLQNKAIKPE